MPGTLLPTRKPNKRDYLRYVETSLANSAAEQRVLAVLNSGLMRLPVFFVNGVASDDHMALWLLQQPSVMEGETQSAAAPTTALLARLLHLLLLRLSRPWCPSIACNEKSIADTRLYTVHSILIILLNCSQSFLGG